jgi:SM-20-related protein
LDRSLLLGLYLPSYRQFAQYSVQSPLLQEIFNTLIDSFINNKVGIADNFLSDTLAAHLKENLTALFAGQQLLPAGIGNESVVIQNKSVRSDIIYWLDRKHNDKHENSFFDLMDSFVYYLNSTCYTGITGYEFHYTLYEKGAFYKKHFDQFRNNNSRQYSMILYLNQGWETKDGGELCIHQHGDIQKISPSNRKMVFFKSSELEHEVMLTNELRMSITGWLKI